MTERLRAIRAKSLEAWVKANYNRGTMRDIIEHGCSSGFPGLRTYRETAHLYDKFREDCWQVARDVADGVGESPLLLLSSCRGGDVGDHGTLANLLVWFAVEETCRRIVEYV